MDSTDPTAATDSVPEQAELLDALARTAYLTMAVLSRVAADHDLSLSQLRMLGILRDRRLRMAELADYLGFDRSTLTGLVDRAVGRGLLRRAPNAADGRAVDVFMTADGRRLARRVEAEIARAMAPATGALAAADRRRLTALLSKLLR